ncbi:hypothetical protein [Pimelobacter simplex]|uniref:hypothetical protein n=1 Tax=Nocardioides simplex TaxID=2045 RepID=UPI001933F2E7|nr:hypothetical protein [Pimelobacter simplex]
MTLKPNLGPDTWAQEPDGSIFVFLDEAYAPYVAYAGVVLEASDAQRLERKIEEDFERMRGWHHLKGLPSFEKFRARGFHASENPPEIQAAFIAFLSETLNFKSMIVYSDRSERPDLSDKKRLMIVLDHLVRDILRKYRRRPKVVLYFESAQAMDPFIHRVAIRAARAESNGKQRVEIRFGTKRDPDLLAVPDYVLRVFGKWKYSFDDLPLILDRLDHRARAVATIAGSISMAKLIDRPYHETNPVIEVIRRHTLTPPDC